MRSLPISFTKMSGAGNTFVLVSAENAAWGDFEAQVHMPRADFAKLICSSTLGVGADGLLILKPGNGQADYVWDFYNADGSTAEMCGNAARCAARYCYEYVEAKSRSHFKFLTGAGPVDAAMLGDDEVRVQMPPAQWVQKEIDLKMHQSNAERFALVNTGVPHLVQKIHQFALAASLKDMAREARHHADLQPAGANVTFYSVDEKDKIKAVTFERGVEDFTLACGTGAVAAALVHRAESHSAAIEVAMPGGNLKVTFVEKQERPLLEGEAVFIGDFKYSPEVFS